MDLSSWCEWFEWRKCVFIVVVTRLQLLLLKTRTWKKTNIVFYFHSLDIMYGHNKQLHMKTTLRLISLQIKWNETWNIKREKKREAHTYCTVEYVYRTGHTRNMYNWSWRTDDNAIIRQSTLNAACIRNGERMCERQWWAKRLFVDEECESVIVNMYLFECRIKPNEKDYLHCNTFRWKTHNSSSNNSNSTSSSNNSKSTSSSNSSKRQQ